MLKGDKIEGGERYDYPIKRFALDNGEGRRGGLRVR